MTQTVRRMATGMGTLLLLGGCASNGCEYLIYETAPESAPPLVMPADVPAPTESGEFRLPPVPQAQDDIPLAGTCLARPPMTLPEEVLREPEEEESEAEETAEETGATATG